MIKEKAFYSYPFQEKCILQRKFKNEKKTQRIPISGWRIHWNQASLDPHTSLPSRGGPRKSQRVQRCSRSFNAYRSGASPSFSLSPSSLLLSSILYARLVCPPFCLFGVLFSEGRLTYRFREGSGHQGWCSLVFAVVSAWSKSDVASSTGEESFFFDRSNRCVSTHVT